MRLFETVVSRIALALMFVSGLSLLLMLGQTVTDVVMNNLFGAPIEGNLEIISGYHMVLVVFLPLAYVELKHEHISADLFFRLMPGGMQRVVYVFGAVVSMLFFGVLALQTFQDAVNAWRINEVIMGSIYVAIWPAKFALPVGFSAIVLVLLLNAWKALTDPDFNPVPADPEMDDI